MIAFKEVPLNHRSVHIYIHINRWYCQLFIRNSKLRWKGNGSNITILFKYTNAWFVSLYFILEVSIMDAGTFQKLLDIWKYSETDAWVNSFMNIYYQEMLAREMWQLYFIFQNWDKTSNKKRFFFMICKKIVFEL